MNRRATTLALVGAESTGKTTLAAALAERLKADGAGRVAWVPERLREWCEAAGRTPRADEQAAILREQHARIAEAAASHDWVVCDTTALMTAVYSRLVFGDHSLDDEAAALHRRDVDATLLTAIDLPWVADGLQRDGPQVREPVDSALRLLMQQHGIGFGIVGGQGETRLARAWAALRPLRPAGEQAPAPGLFTSLGAGRARWRCECCVPAYEQALFSARRRPPAAGSGPA